MYFYKGNAVSSKCIGVQGVQASSHWSCWLCIPEVVELVFCRSRVLSLLQTLQDKNM